MASQLNNKYSIVVFAYNEEKNIADCLSVIQKNVDSRLYKCYLIANGCTDKTVSVAKSFKLQHAFDTLEIIEIEIGDKCNAWNHYIHHCAQPLGCHFMVDSDVKFTPQSFPQLFDHALSAPATTNVVAGMPQSGRNLDFYQSLVRERSCFFGNLYGITPRFFELIKSLDFHLPIGLNWIDSFLTKAANTDITFGPDNLGQRVTFLEGVGFEFESLSPFRLSDIKLYKNRIARYELGKIQEIYLDSTPVADWPREMTSINEDIAMNFEQKAESLGLIKRYLVKKRLAKLLKK